MSTTHTAVFENAILKSTELKADTKIAVGLDTEQTTKELTVVGDAPEIRIQDKTGSNPEVNQTTLSIVADGGVTHFRAGTSTFDTTETKGDIKFQSSTGDSTHAIITGTGRVGVGTMAPTESLDIVGNINLQKVSNTATIKLDSNVVTEYARSKKLMKYPRKTLTYLAGSDEYGTAYNASGYQGYKVTRSSNYPGYEDWEAFDNDIGLEGSQLWASDNTASAGPGYDGYDNTTYVALTNNPNGQHPSAAGNGDWIQIELPSSIYPYTLRMHPRSGYSQNPKTFVFVASEDNSNWDVLIQNGKAPPDWGASLGGWGEWEMDSLRKYKYFAVIVTATYQSELCAIKEIEILGIPEYDPEAHGTDTIMRSVPNVPNTDWLEVYWDANDTTSYSGSGTTVTDLSGNGVTGTITGTNGFDAEYNAWVFDGSGDFIESGTLSLSGDATHSISVWFKATTVNSFRTIVNVTNTTTNGGQLTHTGIRIVNGKLNAFFYADDFNSQVDIVENVWYHAVTTYTGGGSNTVNRKMYLNGVQITEFSYDGTTGNNLNLSSPTICLGRDQVRDMNQFAGSIANTRLFNRALTTDEVWQLYAYQKEYFQVSPDVVTFKGGRLGIGTSEPRAVLDVRGSVQISGFSQVSGGGGTVYTNSKYVVHKFTSSGTFTILEPGLIEYIVVGGGGGGASRHNGGGGGGGVLVGTIYASKGDYVIVIGTGGSGHPGGTTNGVGNHGNPTRFAGLVALGGGGGGNNNGSSTNIGCSSGTGVNPTEAYPAQGYGVQGHLGGLGNSGVSSEASHCGGGGGGAGGAGEDASPRGDFSNVSGGNGGPGRHIYGLGADDSDVYLGGGGGGDCAGVSTGNAGTGGIGGGGDGGKGNAQAGHGEANTGGGGGGAGFQNSLSPGNGVGGNGGSGVVYVRYLK